jgi:hypothetical protein
MIISSQLLRTFPGKGTLTPDYAGIIPYRPSVYSISVIVASLERCITTSKIITPYIIKANCFGREEISG